MLQNVSWPGWTYVKCIMKVSIKVSYFTSQTLKTPHSHSSIFKDSKIIVVLWSWLRNTEHMMYVHSSEIILLILQLHCEETVHNLLPIFSPEPGNVWLFVAITGPGTLQCQIDRVHQFNFFFSVTFTCAQSHRGISNTHNSLKEDRIYRQINVTCS